MFTNTRDPYTKHRHKTQTHTDTHRHTQAHTHTHTLTLTHTHSLSLCRSESTSAYLEQQPVQLVLPLAHVCRRWMALSHRRCAGPVVQHSQTFRDVIVSWEGWGVAQADKHAPTHPHPLALVRVSVHMCVTVFVCLYLSLSVSPLSVSAFPLPSLCALWNPQPDVHGLKMVDVTSKHGMEQTDALVPKVCQP